MMNGILEERLKMLGLDLIGIGADIAFGRLDGKVLRVITLEERYVVNLIIDSVLDANEDAQKKGKQYARGIKIQRQRIGDSSSSTNVTKPFTEVALSSTEVALVEPYRLWERARGRYNATSRYEIKFVVTEKKELIGRVKIPDAVRDIKSVDEIVSKFLGDGLEIRGYEQVRKLPVYEKNFGNILN